MKMWCNRCGKERLIPPAAASSKCSCGSATFVSWQPAWFDVTTAGPIPTVSR